MREVLANAALLISAIFVYMGVVSLPAISRYLVNKLRRK